jgi:glycerol-3-phosphate dehydrogenase
MESIDVLIIGGGVVGVAVARALALCTPYTVAVAEALPTVLQGASSGNSAMIHTGFDCTPGTVEAAMVRRGHELFELFADSCVQRGIRLPWSPLGALMLANGPAELKEIQATCVPRAAANGVRVQLLDQRQVQALEPHVGKELVCGGLLVPGEWCVDPWFYPSLLLAEAVAAGRGRVRVEHSFRVTSVTRSAEGYSVNSAKGRTLHAKIVVNCAGLHGSRVEALRPEYSSGGSRPVPFEVFPRLGRFLVFDASASPLIGRALLPLPTNKTKGVILFRSVYGQVIIGPTAEDPDEPRRSQSEIRDVLLREAAMKVPLIESCPVVSHYAGARPSLRGQSDYFLRFDKDALWLTIAGVRSTGLTSSLALGEYAAQCLRDAAHEAGARWTEQSQPDRRAVALAMQALIQQGVVSMEARHPLSADGWPCPKL